jgi:hypothetical protein
MASGCATTKVVELNEEVSASLESKSFTISKHEKLPSFSAQTAANVQFGLIGLATANSYGNQIIENNKVADPAIEIAKILSDGLIENYNMTFSPTNILVESHGVNELLAAYDNHDYILDVRTLYWGSIYYTSSLRRYQVKHGSRFRLIDSKKRKVVAEVSCYAAPQYDDLHRAPRYEDLATGSRLSEELSKIIPVCVNKIREGAKILHKLPLSPIQDDREIAGEKTILSTSSLQDRLMTDDGLTLRDLAREYYLNAVVGESELDLFANRIWQLKQSQDRYVVDAVSWFCKLILKSKNPRYRDMLEKVAEHATSKKLRKYAQVSHDRLPAEYVEQFSPGIP